ncbi:DUF6348 family protein [Actinomadura sp. NTSP31]|uniref:DUF6348 family protein n=1 Tax=Actinomadura sp. NTSP31 TaxID=1735447 RepID=UPI0035C2490F
MDIGAEEIAGLLARMLADGHALPASAGGAEVEVAGTGVRIAIAAPQPQDNGLVQLPIGVSHPSFGGMFAWDQAVGVPGGDRHPAADALDGWAHTVFPVFAAALLPGCDLAGHATVTPLAGGERSARVYYGPVATRDFGGLTEDDRSAMAGRPPTQVVIEELFTGYALPDRPVWLFTFCARLPSGPITEVTLLNGEAGASFGHIADHLPWHGHGSVKSWALLVPSG